MANLVVDFTGLCAFVPKRTAPAEPDYAATVLLVSRAAQMGAAMEDLHLPALVFPDASRDRTPGLRTPDETFHDDQGTLMGVCWLDGQEITIGGLIPGFTIVDGAVGTCPNGNNASYFSWVAPISKIDGRFGAVEPNCTLKAPDPNIPDTVGARIQLTSGQLYATDFFPSEINPLVCGFVLKSGAASPLQQAIADDVQLKASVVGSQVTFAAAPLQGAKVYPDLKLNVGPGDLPVAVKNLPILDLIGHRPAPAITIGQIPDTHFEHFFRFSHNGPPPGTGYVFFPVAKCNTFELVQSPKCPPGSFSPLVG